MFVKMWCRIF